MTSAVPIGTTSGAVSEAVSRVEAQLASFWCTPDERETRTAKVRASTLNYVVLCAPQDADSYREAAEKLSETHGGRTLLLTMSGRIAPWDLVPDIHAVCRIDNAVPICYDRVDLTFGAVAASRAQSVVATLALPELPTVVEIGAGAPAPLIDNVAGKFDRLIVDSARTPAQTIVKVLQRSKCPVADRAMVRTYAWRELIARFFDGAKPALSAIRRVTVARTDWHAGGHEAGGSAQDPANLIFAWLASRLGWIFTGPFSAKTASGATVDLVVEPDTRAELGPAQLTAVRVVTSLGGEPLDLAIERVDAAPAVRWQMRGARSADREHALGFHDETWVAVKAIDSTEGDAVTRATLLAMADREAHR